MVKGYPSLIHSPIVSQVLSVIFRSSFLNQNPPSPSSPRYSSPWDADTVSLILTTIPRLLFRPPTSIGSQKSFPHSSPFRHQNSSNNQMLSIGLYGAVHFFTWLESHTSFSHTESTCRDMARLLAMVCGSRLVWTFLKSMASRKPGLVTTSTITCLIKLLSQEKLFHSSLSLFFKMRRLNCRPDIVAYNTVIHSLCRSGQLWRARLVLRRMELPWSRCPPDAYTYTTIITFYCRRSMNAKTAEEGRRSMWDANRLFRKMVSRRGMVVDTVAFNSLIDGCCKSGRIGRALELLGEMRRLGCTPNRVTYNSFIRYYSRVNQADEALSLVRRMEEGCGVTPGCSSYTPVIHSMCEAGRVIDACRLMEELVGKGYVPREYTYWFVRNAARDTGCGQMETSSSDMWRNVEKLIEERRRRLTMLKPRLRWKYGN